MPSVLPPGMHRPCCFPARRHAIIMSCLSAPVMTSVHSLTRASVNPTSRLQTRDEPVQLADGRLDSNWGSWAHSSNWTGPQNTCAARHTGWHAHPPTTRPAAPAHAGQRFAHRPRNRDER